jgi:hypothetical protein
LLKFLSSDSKFCIVWYNFNVSKVTYQTTVFGQRAYLELYSAVRPIADDFADSRGNFEKYSIAEDEYLVSRAALPAT